MAEENCPGCGGRLRLVGFFLSRRPDDRKRVCRTPLWCVDCDRVWIRWADRSGPLEPDEPLPPGLKRRLLGGPP